MRLLFIENRYATTLNEAVARDLVADGHEVHWMVQNPTFTPRVGRSHQMAFPRRADLQAPGDDPIFAKLRRADRGVKHFGLSCNHHAHYRREVQRIFETVRPEVIFGESTQLHELVAIEEARQRNLPYLFPTATRYPPGRMCFFAYDSMVPVGGAGETLPVEQAHALIDSVNRRSVTPSYMAPSTTPALAAMARQLGDRLRITYGWWRGERYMTPSPWRKLVLDRKQVGLRQRWDALAVQAVPSSRPYVLYALQMQPESTIDVWGLPWNNQADIVRRAARALAPLGYDLVVKPNPKSKYEIDLVMCAVAKEESNLVPVRHGVPMQELFTSCAAVLSVTGTVLIEAVFAGKPAFSLGTHAMSAYEGVTRLETPEDIAQHLPHTAEEDPLPQATALLCDLHRTSYAAEIVDPLRQSERITPEAVSCLSDAFRHVLKHLRSNPIPDTATASLSHEH